MSKFSRSFCVAHECEEAREFFEDVLCVSERVLFIGTVGLEASSLYFPMLLRKSTQVDYRFIVEKRPSVAPDLVKLGLRHRAFLEANLGSARTQFVEVAVVADDGATVAGRNAVNAAGKWLGPAYSDIVIDATGMSRGTCFPITKQAMEIATRHGANLHLVVAGEKKRTLQIRSETNDRADWVQGFQGKMWSDQAEDIMTLWVPQLSERMSGALSRMYPVLQNLSEVCPILPFPAYDLRRGDNLRSEYRDALQNEWEAGSLDLIYAHETDPLDVFRTVSKLHNTRQRVFGGTEQLATTVLSPNGWRVGSIGMLLAAIEHDLPMLYVETVGYSCEGEIPETIEPKVPDVSWHLWLAGAPYANVTNSP